MDNYFGGFTKDQLDGAFDRVAEPDWKDAGWALVDVDEIPLMRAAIVVNLAVEPRFKEVDPEENDGVWLMDWDAYAGVCK
jgi:hypothetical protein